jgi:hypothetical protein
LNFILLVLVVLVLAIPLPVEARWSLTPRLSVGAEYDDNIFLTETNEEDDFFTTISPGVTLEYETPTEFIDLDYEFRRSLYSDFSELDFSEHRGRVEARKDFGPRFSVGIRDILLLSEDPIELTGITEFETPSIRVGERNRYTRNIVEPDVTFRFGENRSVRVGYRNRILRNDADDVADLDENAINALLSYRFNIRAGAEVFYAHFDRDYDPTVPPEPPRDNTEDVIRGRYTLYLDPRTSGFFQYQYRHIDFDRETPAFVDYDVHEPALGFSRDLRENVNLSAQAGYAVRDADRGEDEEAFSGVANLSIRQDRLRLSLYSEGGIDEDLTSAESLGLNEFWRVGLNGTYQLLERLWADGFFYVERERFTDIRRRDTYYNARGRLRYQFLRWLFLSVGYQYNERDSNRPNESYEDNRFFGRLTAQYDIAERFQ